MSRKRIAELLNLLDAAAVADLNAGRLVWGDQQRELVRLVREYMRDRKPGKRKTTATPWRSGDKTKHDHNGNGLE